MAPLPRQSLVSEEAIGFHLPQICKDGDLNESLRKDLGSVMKKTSTEVVDFVRNEDKVDTHKSVERALFSSMDTDNSGVISKKEWIMRLNDSGIRSDDVRIKR